VRLVDPRAWLSDYLQLLGKLPASYDWAELAKGLLPNQTADADLCSPADLQRDGGIPDQLKEIAQSIGCGVRERLLDEQLAKRGPIDVIKKLIPNELTESELLRACLDHLSTELPDGQDIDDDLMDQLAGSIRLLAYIWTSRGQDGTSLARRCPLITCDDSISHYSPKKIMAPAGAWPERARPFADIYAPSRILDDMYCEFSTESCDVVQALINWGIAFPQPLIRDKRAELKDTVLQHLTGTDVKGVIVRDQEFSQVALLATEVIQRCQETEEQAALLLGFVLSYLASADGRAVGSRGR
jgi:hypothetical protein